MFHFDSSHLIVTRGSLVSRAPPHFTLPAFLNLIDKYFRLKSQIWLQMKSIKFLSLPLTFKIIIRNQNICGSEQEEFVSFFKV